LGSAVQRGGAGALPAVGGGGRRPGRRWLWGQTKLEHGGLPLISGERQCLLPQIPADSFLFVASFFHSDRGTSAGAGDRKLALPLINTH
jgi:hypothetical protein